MKKLGWLIVMFITCGVCSGQNLVPNGDFEQGPDTSSQGWFHWVTPNCIATDTVYGPDFWIVESGSPDRMVEGTIPTCNWDNDSAYSGIAYCVFGSGMNPNPFYEGGKATLIYPLEQDTLYHLSYCASIQTFNGCNFYPELIAFIFNNGGDSIVSPLINSFQWQCYDTVFSSLANSSEIIIRAVYPTSFCPAVNVDHLYLEKITSTGIHSNFDLDEEKVILSPNPANEKLSVFVNNNKHSEILLFDIASRKLFQQKFTTSISINTEQLAKGIYIYEVRNKNGTIKKGKVVKE